MGHFQVFPPRDVPCTLRKCASCIALTHRSCKNVVSIPEDIDNLYQTVSLNDVKLKFSKTMHTMEAIKKTKETKLQEQKGVLNQKIESVKEFRKELQALLKLMELETIQELRREFNRIEASLEKDINEAQILVTSLQEATSLLKKSEGNKAQEFVCIKSSQKLAAKAEQVEKIQQTQSDDTIYYIPDQNIMIFLQQKKTLGKVSIDKLEGKDSICKDEDQKFTAKNGLYRVKKQTDIVVQLQNDKKSCHIWASLITEDGSLLLADNWNKKLKCVDLSTDKVKAYIDLPATPYDVCTVSKTEAAVTLGNQFVQFVSLGDDMTFTRTFTMNHLCYGLHHKDGRLFITDYDKTLYIYDLKGQEQKRITKDTSGNGIFLNAAKIVVSANEDRIFVTDHNKGVVVLDSQWNYLTTLKVNNVTGIYGVCSDGSNVFVSGNSLNNIVQLNQDFKMLGEIGKVEKPMSMSFDHKKRRLIATRGGQNNITVLDLE